MIGLSESVQSDYFPRVFLPIRRSSTISEYDTPFLIIEWSLLELNDWEKSNDLFRFIV